MTSFLVVQYQFPHNSTAKQSCQHPTVSQLRPHFLMPCSVFVWVEEGGGRRRHNPTTKQTSVKLLPTLCNILNNSSILQPDTPLMCVCVCMRVHVNWWYQSKAVGYSQKAQHDSQSPALSHYSHFNQIGAALVTHSTSICNDHNSMLDEMVWRWSCTF